MMGFTNGGQTSWNNGIEVQMVRTSEHVSNGQPPSNLRLPASTSRPPAST